MKLHLELMDFDEEELEVLRKYGRAQNGISRDILVPAEMPLHNLHYVIQKAFGWQNSHLHHFRYEDAVFDGLFHEQFISWVPFCGLYFRFPSEDFDDIYWDDDYKEGRSVKSWLRSKYIGPYYYGGNGEHYLTALIRSSLQSFDANLKELSDCNERKDDEAREALVRKTDYPVVPLSDCLIYRYDYGDDWTV